MSPVIPIAVAVALVGVYWALRTLFPPPPKPQYRVRR
jgi:hypothetical protein